MKTKSRFSIPVKGMRVWDRTRKLKGVMTGGSRLCQLEGCTGLAVGVRWSDGKITYPCTKILKHYYSGVRLT